MGLILCESRKIGKPYFVDDLSINIYSLEELCYVIYNYPYISLDGMIDDRFQDFISNELSIPVQGDNNDEILISILNFSDYYSSSEVEKFKIKINEIRKLSRCEFYKNKADFLFSAKKYGKAKNVYEVALNEASYQNTDSSVYGRIYYCIGTSAANLFEYDISFDAYTKAYTYMHNELILKNIYFLSKMQPVIGKREKYLEYLNDRVNPDWDQEYENAFADSYKNKSIEDFDSGLDADSVKRKKYLTDSLNTLKKEYRSMI